MMLSVSGVPCHTLPAKVREKHSITLLPINTDSILLHTILHNTWGFYLHTHIYYISQSVWRMTTLYTQRQFSPRQRWQHFVYSSLPEVEMIDFILYLSLYTGNTKKVLESLYITNSRLT